jgi:hypothetical protein
MKAQYCYNGLMMRCNLSLKLLVCYGEEIIFFISPKILTLAKHYKCHLAQMLLKI